MNEPSNLEFMRHWRDTHASTYTHAIIDRQRVDKLVNELAELEELKATMHVERIKAGSMAYLKEGERFIERPHCKWQEGPPDIRGQRHYTPGCGGHDIHVARYHVANFKVCPHCIKPLDIDFHDDRPRAA